MGKFSNFLRELGRGLRRGFVRGWSGARDRKLARRLASDSVRDRALPGESKSEGAAVKLGSVTVALTRRPDGSIVAQVQAYENGKPIYGRPIYRSNNVRSIDLAKQRVLTELANVTEDVEWVQL